MTTRTYPVYRRRGGMTRLLTGADDFMSWFLYGHETWLVAVLKGVPLFLFMYFVLFYISNYVYYLVTVELPFLRFSEDVGFLIANGVGMTSFALIIVLALLVQAARGRRGFGWSAIRIFVLLNYLLTVLLIIPIMAFNLAGGSLWPVRIPLQAVGFGTIAAGLGAAACVYLFFEYRRITRREAEETARRSAELAAR
jgi:DMSO/TMAO reductase YedYZ heme-binding membrane subunit